MDWNPAPWQIWLGGLLVFGWAISVAHDLTAIRHLLEEIASKLDDR